MPVRAHILGWPTTRVFSFRAILRSNPTLGCVYWKASVTRCLRSHTLRHPFFPVYIVVGAPSLCGTNAWLALWSDHFLTPPPRSRSRPHPRLMFACSCAGDAASAARRSTRLEAFLLPPPSLSPLHLSLDHHHRRQLPPPRSRSARRSWRRSCRCRSCRQG